MTVDVGQLALIVGAMAAGLKVLDFVGRWVERWFGMEASRQDVSHNRLRKDHDELATMLRTELRLIHERVSREADKRQKKEAELVASLHATQLAMSGNYVTKAELVASETRIIAEIHRLDGGQQ